jgi:signal transduction histidine kinase
VVSGRSGIAPSARGEAYVGEALGWLPGTLPEESDEELSNRTEPVAGPRPRILLADDNLDMRDYLRRLLGQRYEVEAVADGRSALERAGEGRFDLVLSDVMMPGLDGFGLLAELRSSQDTRTLPVVLLSARAGEEARLEGLDAGADDYVVKPFGARELLARIESLLQIRRERMRTTEALREADRRKDEFLALLAHELRNPLAPIRNAAQVLKLIGSENPKEVWAREVIERQSQHLTRLVDDLLDVSRITRGKIRLTREVVTVGAILQRAVESIRPAVDAQRQELVVSLPEEPLRVEGDRVRLVQIVANLLHNAAKYTDEGGRIALSASREDGEVAIRVRDDGIGLREELVEQIFELFRQGDDSLDRAQGGLGIGLTVVRRLVELHGGRVAATSGGPGLGSEFVVHLPLAEATAARADGGDEPTDEEAEAETIADRGGLRVLVVEDNADSAESLRLLLEMAGHEVRTAPDGAAGLEAAERFGPDVVLCDIGLPGMNGYELAERLRPPAGEPGAGRPVTLIALTGYGDDASRERSRRAGFDHHLVKPMEPDALERVLDAVRAERGGGSG